MNRFELAILRILVKRQDSLRVSSLIEGFPDYYLDHVLLAMSDLNGKGYLLFSTHDSEIRVSVNKEKRKEVFEIVNPFSDLHCSVRRGHAENTVGDNRIIDKERMIPFTANKRSSLPIKAAPVISLAAFGLMIMVAIALPGGDNSANQNANQGIKPSAGDQYQLSKYQWHPAVNGATSDNLSAGSNYLGTNPSSHSYSISDHLQHISYYCTKYGTHSDE